MSLSRLFGCAALVASPLMLSAHEFWIEPLEFQVESGAPMVANLKNGQEFQGNDLAYFSTSSTRFDVIHGDKVKPLEGRMGDRPAVNLTAGDDGLVVIVHETTPSRLKYATWEKFAKFVAHKDFKDMEARHTAAGFPREGFRESYTRHVKTLIAVGHGNGADTETGMATEIVAISNPYDPAFTGDMQIKLLLEGAPRPDAQIEVFARDTDGVVTITLHKTDAKGLATIPVLKGHDYLFDAVHIRPYTGDKDAAWETLWAALTFGVPQ